MDRLRKSFRNSFRGVKKKSDHVHVPESSKPHQWQSDETAVRAGLCVFPVKYLGCVEVYDSRGMQICEDALRRLRNSRRRPVKGQLYVSGDGIRVVDDDTKGLIVDQTIEKVSFCAPDRSHERGFSYICRDGTTRRWMCHGFHATKDSGERLSHAVGCAFGVCLERKQKRDKETVNSIIETNKASTANFTRTASFRASSISERMQDPQVAKPAEPVPLKPVHNPYAVERPHATANLLQRQGSLRGGPLNLASPFKRQLSLRLGVDSLPQSLNSIDPSCTSPSSTAAAAATGASGTVTSVSASQRERAHSLDLTAFDADDAPSTTNGGAKLPTSLFSYSNPKVTLAPSVAPIEEVSPSTDRSKEDTASSMIAAMCQQLTHGLDILSSKTEDWHPSHFSPPAALASTTTATTNGNANGIDGPFSFSSFAEKWISTTSSNKSDHSSTSTTSSSSKAATGAYFTSSITGQHHPYSGSIDSALGGSSSSCASSSTANTTNTNNHTTTKPLPLVPPPLVDQMPQVIAPPPPSSPSFTSTVTFDPNAPLMTTTMAAIIQNNNNHNNNNNNNNNNTDIPNESLKTLTNGPDPFDVGWVDLAPLTASSSVEVDSGPIKPSSAPSTIASTSTATSAIPFRSTNPFLDLSQFEPPPPVAPPSVQPLAPSSTTTAQQQIIKAFEVSM